MSQQEYYDSHPNYYTDYSTQALLYRGKFLTEVIDKIPNKSSYKDIEELPKDIDGKYVITWGPSAGKTTAIRQFIVNHFNEGITAVIATKLIKHVLELKYDIISQLVYKYDNNLPMEFLEMMIASFTSSDKNITIDKLMKSQIILCTHERLFIEPSSILFRRYVELDYTPNEVIREYLFVDEYPTSMYKEFDVINLNTVKSIDDKLKINKDLIQDEYRRSIMRSTFIDKVYNEYNKFKHKSLTTGLVENIPTPTNQSLIVDCNRGLESISSTFSKHRVKFFNNLLAEKMLDDSFDEDKTEYLYYSILDLPVKYLYLFDGTGDLLMNNSTAWKVVTSDRFSRKLKLVDNTLYKVNSNLSRKMSNEEIFNKIVELINKIREFTNNEKLLVYMWKCSKKISEDRDTELLTRLSEYYNSDEVRFISYQSGLERVTSEFTSFSNALILGSFFIPQYIIDTLNKINSCELTTSLYTQALIIQFIYRTKARKGNPIKLFIDNSYSNKFVKDLMSNFNMEEDKYKVEVLNPEVSELSSTKLSDRNNLIKYLIDNRYKYKKADNTYLIMNTELAEVLRMTKMENSRIKHKLDSLKIKYEYIEGDRATKTNSLFKISL